MQEHCNRMTTKAMLQEACASVARQWVLAANPHRAPQPFEYYVYVEGRWVWVRIQFNGEEKPPRRRASDRDQIEEITNDRSGDA